MPYIKLPRRKKYDLGINSILSHLKETMIKEPFELCGDMTYIFYKIAKKIGTTGEMKYFKHAWIEKALSKAEDEYKRRISEPYEDNKIKENGDV